MNTFCGAGHLLLYPELMAAIKREWEYHEKALTLKHNRGSFVLMRIAADGSRRPVCRFRVKEER